LTTNTYVQMLYAKQSSQNHTLLEILT